MTVYVFDWDPPKAAQNHRKHGVAFEDIMMGGASEGQDFVIVWVSAYRHDQRWRVDDFGELPEFGQDLALRT